MLRAVSVSRQGEHLLRRFHHGDVHHGALIGHRRSPLTFCVRHRCQQPLIVGNVLRCRRKDLVDHGNMGGMNHDLTAIAQLAIESGIGTQALQIRDIEPARH